MIRKTIFAALSAGLIAGCSTLAQSNRPSLAASGSCTPSVAADGAQLVERIYHAEPIHRPRLRTRAYTLKELAGARLFVHADKDMTAGYLHRAAACHAVAGTRAASENDPLRPTGGIDSLAVHSKNASFVLTVTSHADDTAEEIWHRARALTGAGRVDVEQVGVSSHLTADL